MDSLSRTNLFFLASYVIDEGMPEQGLKYLLKAIELDPVLSESERNIFIGSYRAVANSIRQSCVAVKQNLMYGIIDTEEEAEALRVVFRDLGAGLTCLADEICSVISEQLLPKAENAEKVIYHLVIADFTRFVAELEIDESEEAASESLYHYETASKLAREVLPDYDPVSLNIIHNFAKFRYDVLGQTEEAVELAQETYNSAIGKIAGLDGQQRETAQEILQSLKENALDWATATFGEI
jgi:14-3-3 protein epsilon